MLSPEVVLTPSHVVTQTLLRKYGGLVGIGLELQHRSAPSSPSRLHSRQSSELLEGHEKPIGAGFTQLFFFVFFLLRNRETARRVTAGVSGEDFRDDRELQRDSPVALHHSSQPSWSHLQQREQPENSGLLENSPILHTLLHACILIQ